MAWYDRDYARSAPAGGFGGGAFARRGMAVTTVLLILNIGVFLLDMLLMRSGLAYRVPGGIVGPLWAWGFFSVEFAFQHLQVWRLITFQFLHGGMWHLFGNMIGLYFFGYVVEQWLGSRRFLAFYLLCGIGGVAGYMLLAFLGILEMNARIPMVGASAGIFGILVAAARIAPNTMVMLLFPPIPMRLRTFALVLLGLAVFTVFSSGPNAGGEAAHLGGAAVGAILIRYPGVLGLLAMGGGVRSRQVRGGVGGRAAGGFRRRSQVDPREVDRILEKVKDQGLHSLTSAEKRTLEQATHDQH